MYCTNCGTKIDENSKFCKECGKSTIIPTEEIVNNNTTTTVNTNIPVYSPVHAIILLVLGFFCCGGGIIGLIFPVISLVEGDKIEKLIKEGNITEAWNAKRKSDNWIRATYITYAIFTLLCVLIFALICLFGAATINSSIY